MPRARAGQAPTGQRPVQLLAGHGAARGTAMGRARVRLPHALEVAEQRVPPSQVEAELARLHRAVDAARTEMHELRQRLHGALNQEVG
ncbi:MAG: phosphoenolpyruvate-utilizing N-terminal domain-containing protein, partial [Thermomonas sp.]